MKLFLTPLSHFLSIALFSTSLLFSSASYSVVEIERGDKKEEVNGQDAKEFFIQNLLRLKKESSSQELNDKIDFHISQIKKGVFDDLLNADIVDLEILLQNKYPRITATVKKIEDSLEYYQTTESSVFLSDKKQVVDKVLKQINDLEKNGERSLNKESLNFDIERIAANFKKKYYSTSFSDMLSAGAYLFFAATLVLILLGEYASSPGIFPMRISKLTGLLSFLSFLCFVLRALFIY